MKGLRRSPLVPLLLIVITLLTLVLHEVGYLQSAEDVILRVFTPFQRWFSQRVFGARETVGTLRDLRTLRDENSLLRQENDALVIENVQLNETQAENTRLRSLLDFANANPTYDFKGGEVVARVIGQDPNIFLDYIMLDQGERQGIMPGMPVTTERGLVGRVAQVHETTSEVLLITDPNSAVTAILQTSRSTGLVRGVAGRGLLLDQIPQESEVNEGDIVITSGFGGSFPKGLVIGQVSGVSRRDYEMFQQAAVRPTVDFAGLEQVLIIINFTPIANLGNLPEGPGGPGE